VPVVQCLLAILGSQSVGVATEDGNAARQQAATTVTVMASREEAAKALCQHLNPLLEQIQEMWKRGSIRPGERNALYEAVLIVSATANAASLEHQQKTLEWIWTETCQRWSDPAWFERTLTDALSLLRSTGIKSCACLSNDVSFDAAKAGKERLHMYHAVQLIERLPRRLLQLKRKKGSNAFLAIVPHLKWTIPVVVRLLRCIHYLASPEGRKLLGVCEGALTIGEIEKAFVLGKTASGVSPAAYFSATTGGNQSGGAGPTSSSLINLEADSFEALRHFIKGVRDSSYQFLGLMSHLVVEEDAIAQQIGFRSFQESMASACSEFYAVVMENVEHQDDRCARMMIRGFIIPLVKKCPPNCWRQWLGTILPPLLQHMHSRLTGAWLAHATGQQRNNNVQQHQQGGAGIKSAGMDEEILKEASMREITREHLSLLLVLTAGDEMGHTYFQNKKKGCINEAAPTVFQWMVAECVQAASCLIATAVAALTWPDSETGLKAIRTCRIAMSMTQKTAQISGLQSFIAKDMFTACMSCLTLSSHADIQSEILLVLRDIILRHGDLVTPFLLSLPNIDQGILASFHQAMQTKNSEKDQRNLVRKLLLRSGGSELKALAQQHSPGAKIPQLQSSDFGQKSGKNLPALLDTVSSSEPSVLHNLF